MAWRRLWVEGSWGGGGLWLGLAIIVDRGSPPFFLPPPLTAWLQHTAVTRIHLCHLPTVGLMSSPVKPLKHSTWASPTPGPEAQGLPQRVPRLPLILHKALGRPTPAVLVVTGSWEHHPDSRTNVEEAWLGENQQAVPSQDGQSPGWLPLERLLSRGQR